MRISDAVKCNPFERIKALDATGYAEAFGESDPSTLDSRFLDEWGDRTANPSAFDETDALKDSTIGGIWVTYADKWKRYAELFGLHYDVLKPYSMDATYTREYKTDDATTRTGSEDNRVSGFDSESPVDDTSSTTESTTADKRNQTTTTTRTTSGHQSGRMLSDLVQGELTLHQQMFLGIVLNDMKGELTLSVYD